MNLEKEFSELLQTKIQIPEKKKTLFDIAGFPHYETILSNFYAYYLNPIEDHGLTDLVISVFNKIILKKTKISCIEDYNAISIEREVKTRKGKFIDILISEKCNGGIKNLIIIENKVHAQLYNDFENYFNDKEAADNKIGIILSLKEEKYLPENFINITHKEFALSLIEELGNYFLDADSKSLMIFKEFIQNIMNMTTSDLAPQYDFYLKHETKIRDIIKLREIIIQDVYRQINEACEVLDMQLDLGSAGSSTVRYYYSKKAPVYFTIWIGDLFNEGESLGIYVELDEIGMKYLDEINKIDFDNSEKKVFKETTSVRKAWIHYAEDYQEIDEQNFKNIKEFIFSRITNGPLKSIFTKIENKLIELGAAW